MRRNHRIEKVVIYERRDVVGDDVVNGKGS